MKTNFKVAILFACTLFLTSCGFGSTGASTQKTNSTTSSLSGAAGSVLGNVLGALLNGTTTQSSITGTWVYSSPKVVFESESVLAKIGSSVASSKLENTLTQQLKKIGFTSGKTKLTLNSDNTCALVLNSKTLNGTYTYDSSTQLLTITGALGTKSVSCTATLNGGELCMLYDASKLLGMVQTLGSISSTTSTLSSLLKNYSGLKLGWAMKKQ